MSKRFKTMREKHRGGWTDWVCPDVKGYKMKCCDCGLVHDLQFKTFAETKQNARRGTFVIAELPWPIRTMFRARRERKRRQKP